MLVWNLLTLGFPNKRSCDYRIEPSRRIWGSQDRRLHLVCFFLFGPHGLTASWAEFGPTLALALKARRAPIIRPLATHAPSSLHSQAGARLIESNALVCCGLLARQASRASLPPNSANIGRTAFGSSAQCRPTPVETGKIEWGRTAQEGLEPTIFSSACPPTVSWTVGRSATATPSPLPGHTHLGLPQLRGKPSRPRRLAFSCGGGRRAALEQARVGPQPASSLHSEREANDLLNPRPPRSS